MKKNKKQIFSIIIEILLIIIGVVCLIVYLNKNKFDTTIGIVVPIQNNIDYTAKLITTYDEYKKILLSNNIDIKSNNKHILTEKDFENADYIIDYIPYEDELQVLNIHVEIIDSGVIMNYKLNKKVEENTNLILYTIALNKGQISEFNLTKRNFIYE